MWICILSLEEVFTLHQGFLRLFAIVGQGQAEHLVKAVVVETQRTLHLVLHLLLGSAELVGFVYHLHLSANYELESLCRQLLAKIALVVAQVVLHRLRSHILSVLLADGKAVLSYDVALVDHEHSLKFLELVTLLVGVGLQLIHDLYLVVAALEDASVADHILEVFPEQANLVARLADVVLLAHAILHQL